MKIIQPSIEVLTPLDGDYILEFIEKCGRVCYKSEGNIIQDSTIPFIRRIIDNGHDSVIEHETITIKIICDRGVTHEIVRHRIASYSQESTRYCNYAKDKFGNEITVIKPCFWDENEDAQVFDLWLNAMLFAERTYMKMIELGVTPEKARSVLPNSLKTEIVVTMNLREWRHFLKLRTSKRAHPQMREISEIILNEFRECVPVIFEDIEIGV